MIQKVLMMLVKEDGGSFKAISVIDSLESAFIHLYLNVGLSVTGNNNVLLMKNISKITLIS